MLNWPEIKEQGKKKISYLKNRKMNAATWHLKQSKNQNRKNCEKCALHISIPAEKLIPVRTFRFGRGRRKF